MRFELGPDFVRMLALYERREGPEAAAELREMLAMIRQAVESSSTPVELEEALARLGLEVEEETDARH